MYELDPGWVRKTPLMKKSQEPTKEKIGKGCVLEKFLLRTNQEKESSRDMNLHRKLPGEVFVKNFEHEPTREGMRKGNIGF